MGGWIADDHSYIVLTQASIFSMCNDKRSSRSERSCKDDVFRAKSMAVNASTNSSVILVTRRSSIGMLRGTLADVGMRPNISNSIALYIDDCSAFMIKLPAPVVYYLPTLKSAGVVKSKFN